MPLMPSRTPWWYPLFALDHNADALSQVVRRVNRAHNGMVTNTITAAELLVLLGLAVPPDPEMGGAQSELLLESAFLQIQTLVFDGQALADRGGRPRLQIGEPV